ncbi:MAG: hypothetical protein ACLU4J_14840 [Butyricimonas paravirosa]
MMKNQFDLALEDINLYLAERVRVDKMIRADFTPYKVNLAKIKAFYDGKEEFLILNRFMRVRFQRTRCRC